MGLVLGFLCVVLIVQAIVGLAMVSRTNDVVRDIYERRTEPVRMVGRVTKLMADNRAQVLLGLQHDPASAFAKMHDHPISFHHDQVRKNIAEITAIWAEYDRLVEGDEHRKLASAYADARKKYVQDGLLAAIKAQEDGNFSGLESYRAAKGQSPLR